MFLELNSKDCSEVQEKKRKSLSLYFRSPQNVKLDTCSRAVTAKKCTKHDARAKLLLNLLLF